MESPQQTSPKDTTLGRNTSRRPHRKSRLGCISCKKRRVKCDEARPICSYCKTRSLPCTYPKSTSSPSSDQQSPSETTSVLATAGTPNSVGGRRIALVVNGYALDQQPAPASMTGTPTTGVPLGSPLNVADLELLFTYTTSTVNCFSHNTPLVDFWREEVPRLGFTYHFVLHGIFALSSIQLARFRRERTEYYAALAAAHWHQGLRMAGALLPQIDEENCHALYIFAIVSSLYSLAKGPRPGDFLLFGDDGEGAEWGLLFRGIGPIAETWWDAITRGPLAPLCRNVHRYNARFLDPAALAEERPPFRQLRALVHDMAGAEESESSESDFPAYLEALNTVSRCYFVTFDEEGGPDKGATEMVMMCFYKLVESDRFLELLRRRLPLALIIFAYFIVMFKEVDFKWISGGWAPHLMSGVYAALTPSTRIHISWAIQRLGWIPPG